MAIKKPIKKSEARILVYLNQVDNTLKNISTVSLKLSIDYAYLIRILHQMKEKGWLQSHRFENKTFYDLCASSPIKEAKEVVSGGEQTVLRV